jgi:ABC-type cobalamin/Fe3+-siderophores transport system ATPase subunit
MPCRDYEYDDRDGITKLKAQNDKLARIACKALAELEKNGVEDLLLLGDDEVRDWWKAHKEADAKAAAEKAEKARLAKLRREALSKLSDEEKKVLGIKK